jgi:signal transduction histidine kinase
MGKSKTSSAKTYASHPLMNETAASVFKNSLEKLRHQEISFPTLMAIKKSFSTFLKTKKIATASDLLATYYEEDQSEGQTAFLLATIADLLCRNLHMQEEIKAVSAAYDDVVGLLTHESKNILASVHGYHILMEKELQKADKKEILGTLQSSDRLIQQLFHMSDSLLKLSLSEKELIKPDFKLINFNRDIVIPLEKDLLSDLQQKRMTILTNINGDDVILEGDDNLLEIALRNLLLNAIKYGRKNTQIILNIVRSQKECSISVTNESATALATLPENLFEKFMSRDLGQVKGGSGIGLYNVKKIIELHQGRISSSLSAGNRITFEIVLPLLQH